MDRRARNDIKPLPFSAGENGDVDYNDYDKIRKILPIRESRSCFIGARTLANEMSCPICLDLLSQTMTAKECLHRFCSECITMALQRGNKECPTCRKKLVSKRSLRPDPNFDVLINRIWPDRSLYEQLQILESANAKKEKEEEEARQREESRKRSLETQDDEASDLVEDFELTQTKKRKEDEEEDFTEINCDDSQDQALADLDNVDTTPDAIHEDFETNEDDAVFEGEIDLDARDLQEAEQVSVTPNVPPSGQDVDTFMLESGAPPTEQIHPGEWDGYDDYDPYCGMNGLTAEQQEELQADIDELEILEYDYYESDDSDEEEGEGCDDDDDNDDDTEDNGDSIAIDDEDMDVDVVDTEVVDDAEDDVQTSQDAPESSNTSQNADSVATSARTENTSTEGTDSCLRNENAHAAEPSTSTVPLPSNGTAAPVSAQRQTSVITTSMDFNPNFEVKFESISPPNVDNGETIDIEILPNEERKEGSDDDSESTTTTYSSSGCTSTTSEESSSISIIFSDDDEEFQLNTIFPTELPITDIEAAAMLPSTSGFASISQYPGSSPLEMSLPSSSTLPGPSSVILPGPSTSMPIGTSTTMIPGSTPSMMPGNLSIMGAPSNPMMPAPSSSKMTLAPPPMISGPTSSMIAGHSSTIHSNSPGLSGNGNSLVKLPPTSLSALAAGLPPCPDLDAVDRLPEGSADQIRPPCNMIPPAERLNHWLANSPSSPQSPEDMAAMPERRADDVDMMEPAISGSEEMEAELIPAHSLSQRECPEELLVPRYVRAKHDTKMAHLSEFIHLRAMEEAQSNQTDFDADPVPTIPQPKHFYVFSRNGGHHVKQIFLHETMTTASCAMTQGDHLVIFYDIDSIDLRTEKQSILSDVVPPHFLSLPTV